MGEFGGQAHNVIFHNDGLYQIAAKFART
jgi:hypothetical protein